MKKDIDDLLAAMVASAESYLQFPDVKTFDLPVAKESSYIKKPYYSGRRKLQLSKKQLKSRTAAKKGRKANRKQKR